MEHAIAFARECHQKVVTAIITARSGKAMGKVSALQISLERLAHTGLGYVVIALPVDLARAS